MAGEAGRLGLGVFREVEGNGASSKRQGGRNAYLNKGIIPYPKSS